VRLPNGVFAPYTGIKTNLLFFTKGTPTQEVWYYEHPYPAGVKNYNKTKPIRIEEFDAEKAWWGSDADGFAAACRKRTRVEGQHRPDQGCQLQPGPEEPPRRRRISHDPEQLLADYARLQGEAQALRDELKNILAKSLSSPR
jgi:type I restriction enzyme M protein